MLAYRLVTGIILIVLLTALLWADALIGEIPLGWWTIPPGLVLAVLAAIVIMLGVGELCQMAEAHGIRTHRSLTIVSAIVALLSTWLSGSIDPGGSVLLATVLAVVLASSLVVFSHGRRVEDAFPSTAVVLLITVYLGILSGFLLLIGVATTTWMIGAVALVVKSCDMGAYFTGRALGRHKLIPWLSPGKTVEGLMGGILASMVVATILNVATDLPYPWWSVLIMGAVLAVVGQAGDLTMSLFKRGAQIKDSSSLIPGLGGVMDVVDSLLLAAPVAWWMVTLSA